MVHFPVENGQFPVENGPFSCGKMIHFPVEMVHFPVEKWSIFRPGKCSIFPMGGLSAGDLHQIQCLPPEMVTCKIRSTDLVLVFWEMLPISHVNKKLISLARHLPVTCPSLARRLNAKRDAITRCPVTLESPPGLP